MTHSESLYKLIKAMSMSEKRYFKIYAKNNTFNSENVYLKLFNCLEKQHNFDQKELDKKMKIKNISAYKNYLYSSILKSLIDYKSIHSPETHIQNDIQAGEILREKGLRSESVKILKRAYKNAKKYDIQYEVLKINHLLRTHEHRGLFRKKTPLKEYLLDEQQTMEKLHALNKINMANDQMFLFTNGKLNPADLPQSKYNKIVKPVLNIDTRNSILNSAKLFNIKIWYLKGRKNKIKVIEYIKEHLQTWDDKEHLKTIYPNNYTLLLTNSANHLKGIGEIDLLQKVILQMREFSTMNIAVGIKRRLLYVDYIFSQHAYIVSQEKTKVLHRFQEAQKWYMKEGENLNKYEQTLVLLQMGCDNLYLDKYKTCLSFFLRIINDTTAEKNHPNFTFAKLFAALAFFELKKEESVQIWVNDIIKNHSVGISNDVVVSELINFLPKGIESDAKEVRLHAKNSYDTIMKKIKEKNYIYWDNYQLINWILKKSLPSS